MAVVVVGLLIRGALGLVLSLPLLVARVALLLPLAPSVVLAPRTLELLLHVHPTVRVQVPFTLILAAAVRLVCFVSFSVLLIVVLGRVAVFVCRRMLSASLALAPAVALASSAPLHLVATLELIVDSMVYHMANSQIYEQVVVPVDSEAVDSEVFYAVVVA